MGHLMNAVMANLQLVTTVYKIGFAIWIFGTLCAGFCFFREMFRINETNRKITYGGVALMCLFFMYMGVDTLQNTADAIRTANAQQAQKVKEDKEFKAKVEQELEEYRNKNGKKQTQTVTPEKPQRTYSVYNNDNYGFSIECPSDFQVQNSNDQGIILLSSDGSAQIFVVGANKTDNATNHEDYIDQVNASREKGVLGYHTEGDDWFVVTWKKDGKSFYLKKFTGANREHLFTVIYPTSQQDTYGSIIEHMEGTFRRK